VLGKRAAISMTRRRVASIWLVCSITPSGLRCPSNGTSTTTWPWLANCWARIERVRLSACPSESLRTITVRCSRPVSPRAANQSIV
jgi:hypothetical protein